MRGADGVATCSNWDLEWARGLQVRPCSMTQSAPKRWDLEQRREPPNWNAVAPPEEDQLRTPQPVHSNLI
eukprot:10656968-Alexandrium_andersonii.AAC.1